MDNNNLHNLRSQVMENSEELQDFLRDLKGWEQDMKEKDEELRSKPLEPKILPAIRKPVANPKIKDITDSKSTVNKELASNKKGKDVLEPSESATPKPTEKRISSYDYAAWDKFDVDQAVKKVETAVEKNEKSNDVESSFSSDGDDELMMQQNAQKALLEKDKGNRFFSEGKYDDAIACYTTGILADPRNAVLPANRAMALLKKGQLVAAEQDCTLSISLDCTYVKAFHRRGTCRFSLKKYQLARQDFLKVLEMEPTNKFARAELDKLEQEFIKMDSPKNKIPIKELSDGENVPISPSSELKQVLKIDSSLPTTSTPTIIEKSTNIETESKKKSYFADLPDQVKPIYKPAHKKSKRPLHRITVDVRSSDEEEIVLTAPPTVQRPSQLSYNQPSPSGSLPTPSTPLFTPSTPKSVPATPLTAFQFETDWRRLVHWPHLRLEYLQQVSPEKLSKMYQQSIETEVLIGIIHSVRDICLRDKVAAFLYLKHLTNVGRFATLVMFMADEEIQVVRDILEDITTVTTAQEIENLKILYGIKKNTM